MRSVGDSGGVEVWVAGTAVEAVGKGGGGEGDGDDGGGEVKMAMVIVVE